MRAAVFLMVTGLILLPVATAQGQYANVTGPDFLKPFGPHEPYQDEPIIAVIVAACVGIVILRGLYKEWGRLPLPLINGEEGEPDDDVSDVGEDE